MEQCDHPDLDIENDSQRFQNVILTSRNNLIKIGIPICPDFDLKSIGNSKLGFLNIKLAKDSNEVESWSNPNKNDSVAQFRVDCLQQPNFDEEGLPIMTDGIKWIIFNQEFLKISLSLRNRVNGSHILLSTNTDEDDFLKKMQAIISSKN